MTILIINTYDKQGGAARAAYRLHLALLENGINSKMLVQHKNGNDKSVLGPSTKIQFLLNRIKITLEQFPLRKYKKKEQILFSPNWLPSLKIIKRINKLNPDIVHLHWISFGMIRIEDIAKIKAPIVWTLHDNWAFTGGCHVILNCEKYKESCGNCPNLSSNIKNDLSSRIFTRKFKTYSKLNNITLVGLSKWMTECAKNSFLFKNRSVINLPNPIDTNLFKPLNKKKSRDMWNLPHDKDLILFVAQNDKDLLKGFEVLIAILQKVLLKNIEFVIIGKNLPTSSKNIDLKKYYLGEIKDDISLVTIYDACDVTVVPSKIENLCNVIMESMASGTPVVAFNNGGNQDMIEHLNNGYLARPYDLQDFASGIEWIIKNGSVENLSTKAREIVLTRFSNKVVSEKYIELYKTILA